MTFFHERVFCLRIHFFLYTKQMLTIFLVLFSKTNKSYFSFSASATFEVSSSVM